MLWSSDKQKMYKFKPNNNKIMPVYLVQKYMHKGITIKKMYYIPIGYSELLN